MEVEVKLQILDNHHFNRLKQLLSPSHVKTLYQRNFFYDTPSSALSSRRAVLRLRHVSTLSAIAAATDVWYMTLKGNARLVNGVSRVEEDEEEINPVDGEACLSDSSRMGVIGSRIINRCWDEFGLTRGTDFVCLGGFENVRDVHRWKDGLNLEVDETKYAFGTYYEVECETNEPELVKANLERFFQENDIDFNDSKMSKFAIFKTGKLPSQGIS